MVAGPALHRAFAIWFRDLTRWNPGSFRQSVWHWPIECIKPLGTALVPKHRVADKGHSDFSKLPMLTLGFDGEISLRGGKKIIVIKGNLFIANAGDVVFSKIDVRNGAIGIVPESMPSVAVTSEFPVYGVRKNIALPSYIRLLFRTEFFRKTINSMISGASGRKRVQPSQLMSVEVPLPPLPVQQTIVDRWEQAQKEIAAGQDRILCKERETTARFIRELGLTPPKLASGEKGFAVQWKDFARWSVSYNHTASSLPDLTKGKYPVVSLGAILEMVQYGTSEKANQAENGMPILRINNIKDGRIDPSDLKHILIQKKQKDALRLEDGDVLIIRTSGSRNLVGTCAAFHEEGEFCFASYLIRLRVRKNRATPDFVAYYINSPLGRQQVDSLSRKIMQNNINSEEIRSFQIPLPPLPVQQEILLQIVDGRAEVSKIRGAVREIASDAKREIEALILGTKKVDGREPTRLTS